MHIIDRLSPKCYPVTEHFNWEDEMKIPRRMFLHLAAGAAVLPALTHIASAQSFPTRPITIIVPFPAGGPADAIARIIGERMRATLGQPVIIENVAGAGGSIGVGRAARAAPDGYTLSIGQLNSHVFSGAIYSVRYDLLRDFDPVALLTTNPLMIVGKKDLPATKALLKEVRRHFLPNTIVILADANEGQKYLGAKNEAVRAMSPVEGKPAAYVCENFTCKAPVTDLKQLSDLLKL